MDALRSALFLLVQLVTTPVFGIIALLTFPLPRFTRHWIISRWSFLTLFFVRSILGIRYRVLGRENIPERPSVILAKHQSAWETLAFQEIFPPQVWVLKKSLLSIPFLGWGLAMMSPIAIDRSRVREAMKHTVELGRHRLEAGFWVVIFPEGTRVRPGERGRYRTGGAALAVGTGAPVVPVAHNAGRFWPKNSLVKHPGTVTVSIGPAIDTQGRDPGDVMREVEDWIEGEMARIDPPAAQA
ncbi:MAG: lysophospholipid acyltransferase family protein [Pseudomonadota bacterium]